MNPHKFHVYEVIKHEGKVMCYYFHINPHKFRVYGVIKFKVILLLHKFTDISQLLCYCVYMNPQKFHV
jgi:hypothetical protein